MKATPALFPFSKIFPGFHHFSSLVKRHIKHLFPLWGAASLTSLSNGIVFFLLAAFIDQKTFALYAVGQAISILANAWTDGGIAFALQTLSSQEKNNKSLFEFYYKEGMRLSLKVGIPLSLFLGIFLFLFHIYGSFGKELSWEVITLFFSCGLLQNRIGFCSAFLYALGDFKSYGFVQAFSPALRLFLVLLIFLFQGSKTSLSVLLSVDLLSFFSGWSLSGFFLRLKKKKLQYLPLDETEQKKRKREISRFMWPAIQANVLLSSSHTVGTFAGAFFGGSSTVALYSLFQRVNQLTMLAVGPLSGYLSRKLILTEDEKERYTKAKRFLSYSFLLSLLFVFFLLGAYLVGEKFSSHYAFHDLQTFQIFLLCNFLVSIYAFVDNFLVSWRYSGHRLLSSWLFIGKFIILCLCKPTTAFSLFALDAFFLFLIDTYYFIRFLSFGRKATYEQAFKT
ncbi:hypothetical protein [Candidatus Methylacidiphilum infernorum]|uniref:Na+-driven multidrug efflux pump n=1 Tax=Methylacidiphilum infernorum (isolate V4) TaxID=481448 RepID=B3DZI9_METI4|nr:hypothetical protein [Candidatus Methylacidiphilum infernorum]ACD82606.1 Hypothetical protein Minf_0548 [Methylacidiphilum infernorum V4]